MRVTVYTSSSDAIDERFAEAARELGRQLGQRGDELIYGGTAVGVMGVLADTVRRSGGRVHGVIPRLMVERGIADDACDELLVTDGMSGRKQVMIERADAFVALPGGFGTLEELLEVLTLKQLGYHDKAIALLNVDGFYDPLFALFDHLYAERFAKPEYAQLYHAASDVDGMLAYLDDYAPTQLPSKWF